MGAQTGLRVVLLTFALMSAQPSYSLEWELVTEIEESSLSNVPGDEVEHTVQHGNLISPYASKRDLTQNEYLHDEKSQQDLRPQRYPNDLSGPSIEKSLQKYDMVKDDKISRPSTDRNDINSVLARRMGEESAKDNNEIQTTETSTAMTPVISLQAVSEDHIGSNSYSEKKFEDHSHQRWELVQSSGIADNRIETTDITSTAIAWEVVPTGEEITLSEIDASINSQKLQKKKAEEKLARVVSQKSRIGWLGRLVSRLRPNKRDTNSIELNADSASQENVRLVSTMNDHNISYLEIGQSGQSMRGEVDETSIIVEGIANSNRSEATNGNSEKDLFVETISANLRPEESSPVPWNTKPLASAFQLIRIRF